MALREETKRRIEELLSREMTPQNYRDLDALYDSLPTLERMEAANYGTMVAEANMRRALNS
jgi:hypothetical protein